MSHSLFFKFKPGVAIDKHRLIEVFFKDWVDGVCNNRVRYTIQRENTQGTDLYRNMSLYTKEVFRVVFDKQEDAVILRLKGVPPELHQYIEEVIR